MTKGTPDCCDGSTARAGAVEVKGFGEYMDKYKLTLMRELQKEYYQEKKKDEWADLKYLGVRIGLVGLLAIVVLSIWPL